MYNIIFLIVLACFLSSCTNNKIEEAPPVVNGKALNLLSIAPEKIKGTYVGDFKGSPIAITLNYVSNSHVSGYNVHKGLTRNISGSIEATENGLHLLVEEPGNNQYDGKFDLVIDTIKWTGNGNWKPFKKGEETNFNLKKQKAASEEEQFGLTFTDSLQNSLTLKSDGSCTYMYLTDTTNTGQELTIRGNYTKETNTYTFYWQKNDVFPQKSVFKLIETKPDKDSEYIEKSLKGEGKLFTQIWN